MRGQISPFPIRSLVAVNTLPCSPWWHLAELKQGLSVELRKLDHSIVFAAISQWRHCLAACVRAHSGQSAHIVSLLVSGLTVGSLRTFSGVIMVQCVKWMLRIFEFAVLLFCLSPKCNLSKTFYQVRALHSWGGKQSKADSQLSLKLLRKKLERLVADWWRYAKKVVGFVFCGHTV